MIGKKEVNMQRQKSCVTPALNNRNIHAIIINTTTGTIVAK